MSNSALRRNRCRQNQKLKLRKLHTTCAIGMQRGERHCPNAVDANGEIRTVSPVWFVEWRKRAHLSYAVRPVGGLAWYTDARLTAHALAFAILFCYSFIYASQPATFAVAMMQFWYHWHNRLQAHRTFTTWAFIASATAMSKTHSNNTRCT